MTQRILTLFTALTLALVGCASAQSITDMTGREIVLDAPAQRVIAKSFTPLARRRFW